MKNRATNILLFLATIAVVLAAGEMVLRGIESLAPQAGGREARLGEVDYRGWRPDPVMNRAHIPNLHFTYVVRDSERFGIPVTYNDKGLHDYEYAYEKGEKTVRVIVLGDSFVEALQVERDQNFCKRIERTLNDADPDRAYQVINMGVSGYSPILQYLYLKREGMRYDPDIVLFCFFMNDVYEDSVYKGLATFDEAGLPTGVRPEGSDKTERLHGWKGYERRFCNAAKAILNRSRFYSFLKGRIYRLLTAMRIRKVPESENPFFILTEERIDGEARMWEDSFRFIRAAEGLARSHGAKFLLITIPIASQLSEHREDAAFRSYFHEKPDSGRSASYLGRFCAENDVTCIHLLDEFRQRASRDIYFAVDGHFNTYGHEEVADIIVKKLRRLGWLKEQTMEL
jgi:hypothetical protein